MPHALSIAFIEFDFQDIVEVIHTTVLPATTLSMFSCSLILSDEFVVVQD